MVAFTAMMPPAPSSHRLRTRATALVLVLLTACGGCHKTDAERAAEERATIEKRIRDSYTLVPYRAMKVTLRSQGEPNAPEEVAALWKALDETHKLPEKAATEEEARLMARTYLELGVSFYKARKTLQKRDEDEFPLVWTKWLPGTSPVLPAYDAGQEHALFAALWFVLELADKDQRVPSAELVFYELSRATPQPTWRPAMRLALRGTRGMAFCQAGYHYAAEEELNGYLTELEAQRPEDLATLEGVTAGQSREALLATGYFLRAWNRMGLQRERAAEDDIERGLTSLEKLGVENELTWWGWAFIHFRRERYEESAKYLDKLAASPFLDEAQRHDVQASANEMRRHGKKLPIFLQARAALILGQALLARAGGLEHLLVTVLGPERAEQVYAPVAWMNRVRQGMGALTPEKLAHEAGDTLDKAREASGKGLEALKRKWSGSGGTAESGPK